MTGEVGQGWELLQDEGKTGKTPEEERLEISNQQTAHVHEYNTTIKSQNTSVPLQQFLLSECKISYTLTQMAGCMHDRMLHRVAQLM